MIKIEKIITIDKEDAETLTKVCEAARIYLQQNKIGKDCSGIFRPEEVQQINGFLDAIRER